MILKNLNIIMIFCILSINSNTVIGMQCAPVKNKVDALSLAASTKNLEMVNMLLLEGIDPNQYDSRGKTPLYEATLEGYNTAVLKTLIAKGSNPNLPTQHGHLPLGAAIYLNYHDDLDSLLEHGANPNILAPATGINALHTAAEKKEKTITQQEILVKLLIAGANPQIKNRHNKTANQIAQESGNLEAQEIIEAFTLTPEEEKRLLTLAGSLNRKQTIPSFPPDIQKLIINKDFTNFINNKFITLAETLKKIMGSYEYSSRINEQKLKDGFTKNSIAQLKMSKPVNKP